MSKVGKIKICSLGGFVPFGDFDVNITVPADHVMEASWWTEWSVYAGSSKRYELAQKTFDKPVVIVTQAEAEAAEKAFLIKKNMEI
jgi:hypothetical protein